jgi:hypothetical protein
MKPLHVMSAGDQVYCDSKDVSLGRGAASANKEGELGFIADLPRVLSL